MKYLIILISCLLLTIQFSLIHKALQDIQTYSEIKEKPYTPKPKYRVLGYTSTKAEIKEAIAQEFGHKMVKIVECESGFNLKAYNPKNRNKTTDSGLFQINSSHRGTATKMNINLDTVEGQFKYARFLVDKNGYRDWVCARKLKLI